MMIFNDELVNNLVNNKSYHVFTHKDLDGAVSLLTFIWSKPDSNITFQEITNLEIDKIKKHINKTINPQNIIILDLALREEFIPELDQDFITIIDHHERSSEWIQKFKKSKIIHKEYTSNCLLIRKLFQNSFPDLSENQKKLILYTDDYDCFQLKFEESYDLNIIFWNQFKNNFEGFINFYKNGFIPFTQKQKELIKNIKDQAEKEAKNLKCFKSEIIIQDLKRNCMAVMSDSVNNITMDFLIKNHNPDIFMYINTKTEKVIFKQNKNNNNIFNLNDFVAKYSDGSANKYSGVGKITPLFLELTKNFKQI
jgi:hypothetical protein